MEVKKVSVFCIFRDSEPHLEKFLKQLEEIEKIQEYSFSYFFYENDSKDNTELILKNWLKNRSGRLLSEKLDAPKFRSDENPERMKFLCSCRNKCKELAGQNDSDYTLLVDSDIEFRVENFLIQVSLLNNIIDAVMICPNIRQNLPDYTFGETEDSYYDVYAFRDSKGNRGFYFSNCPFRRRVDKMKWNLGIPVEALSCFGGFVILKSEVFNKVKWSADYNCDHVDMCFDISRYGKIYVAPKSITRVHIDISRLNLQFCMELASTQRESYNLVYP